jgi:hypothetical protein
VPTPQFNYAPYRTVDCLIWQWLVMVDEVWIEIQVDCRQVPIGEQGGDQFLGNLLVASDGHAAMISRPPPRHHWFTDRMTSERTHIFRGVAALAGLFFVVAVVLMASAPRCGCSPISRYTMS